jgi:hypothetical protein
MPEQKQLDIRIHTPEDNSTSSEDTDRLEMPWEQREEQYLQAIQTQCRTQSTSHEAVSKTAKKQFASCSIPSIVLPIVLGAVNPYLSEEYNYINSVGMMLTGIIGGVNTFYNFGKKTTVHNEYAGRYAELAGYIQAEMCKPKKFRVQCDLFLERVNQKFNSLNSNAPML